MSSSEPRNPFYSLLIAVSFAFCVTVLALAFVPVERQPAWLQFYGLYLVLVELAALILFGLLSMGLDRFRSQESGGRSEKSGVRDQNSNQESRPEVIDERHPTVEDDRGESDSNP